MKVKDDVHAPMGIAVTSVVLILAITGVVTRLRLLRGEANQNKLLCIKMVHKVFAYFMLLTSQITIFFGIYSYTHNRGIETTLHFASLFLFVALACILEAWHQHFLHKDAIAFKEPLNTMSDEEFQMEV